MRRPRPWPSRDECLHALRSGDGAGVTVAILDTGIDLAHPDFAALDFAGALEFGDDSSPEPCAPRDPSGHGTSIAGIVHRIAPSARIMSIAVLDAQKRQHRHEMIRQGAELALHKGAAILNCSFGVPGILHTLPAYQAWTALAFRHSVSVIAASSNASAASPEWPACCGHVIGVGAADLKPGQVRFEWNRVVPFLAAGSDVRVPLAGGGHALVSGSSFAAAQVTGLLAKLLSAVPSLSPSMAREALERWAEIPEGAAW